MYMYISINHTQKNNERENKLVPTNPIKWPMSVKKLIPFGRWLL